ncbi:amidase signature enzyme [Tothia fuscella]|uniref:Amidase signature enzyme n=1 Tax=Tothia fuscella TaxID=1048955 RepID=A0A9P4NKS5_9PEZI|nr:amidase signature enzyme [Tothia fuscella]
MDTLLSIATHLWPTVTPVPSKLWALTATEVLSPIKEDRFTVEDYAKSLLTRIESRNGLVKAWQYLDRDLVMKEARALDKVPRDQRGPLHGVAIAIKDIMDTKDMPTEYGSSLYSGNRPNADASLVAIFRRARALIVGKTTTTEFIVLNSGPDTTNPHNPERTPGGSSAGSAAAVADFQVPLSFGTQTGGSVIRPASYTGTYAMKPTFNVISGGGIKVASLEFDTIGYFARTLDDLKLITGVLSVMTEEPVEEIPLKETKVGFVKSPFWPSAGPGTIAAMQKAAEILRSHGVTVEEVEFPDEFNDATTLDRMFKIVFVTNGGVSFYNDYLMDTTKTNLDPDVRAFVEGAPKYPREQVRQALDYYMALRPVFDGLAPNYSVLITPSATDEAPLGLGDMGSLCFNSVWTAAHMPVIHVPAFAGPNDMPVGLSLIARRYCDQYLLNITRILSEPLMREGIGSRNWITQKLNYHWILERKSTIGHTY